MNEIINIKVDNNKYNEHKCFLKIKHIIEKINLIVSYYPINVSKQYNNR
jgi:hypothetical protein